MQPVFLAKFNKNSFEVLLITFL